jgi:hypothetical protein
MENKAASIAICTLRDMLSNDNQYMSPSDASYVDRFIQFASDLNHQGLFAPGLSTKLRHMAWSDYNCRYGINSLNGFICELFALIKSNKQLGDEFVSLLPEDKKLQVGGADLQINKSTWKRPYIAQVKRCSMSVEAGTMTINDSWIAYKQSNVDRLMLVDIDNDCVVSVEYSVFKHIATQLLDGARYTTINFSDLSDPTLRLRII